MYVTALPCAPGAVPWPVTAHSTKVLIYSQSINLTHVNAATDKRRALHKYISCSEPAKLL